MQHPFLIVLAAAILGFQLPSLCNAIGGCEGDVSPWYALLHAAGWACLAIGLIHW